MNIEKSTNLNEVESFLRNNFSSPTHWPDWNVVVSKHYNTRFYYLIALENSQILGICPIHEISKGILKNICSGKLFFLPNGGWIFDEPINFNLSRFSYPVNTWFTLTSLPILDDFKVKYLSDKAYTGTTLVIDLKLSLEKIWSEDINSKRRIIILRNLFSFFIIITPLSI